MYAPSSSSLNIHRTHTLRGGKTQNKKKTLTKTTFQKNTWKIFEKLKKKRVRSRQALSYIFLTSKVIEFKNISF